MIVRGLGADECPWYKQMQAGGCAVTPFSILAAPAGLVQQEFPSVWAALDTYTNHNQSIVVTGLGWALVLGLVFSAGGGRRRR